MNTVVISGYFNPLHYGHVEYIRRSSLLGDKTIVIVNNDYQQILKIGKIIQNENERLETVRAIKYVDEAVLSIDQDRSVVKTLEGLAKQYDHIIFANGGDRVDGKVVPETALEGKYNIDFVYGVCPILGSSSKINKDLGMPVNPNVKVVPKSWGYEIWMANTDLYCGKILHINQGHCTSYHYHNLKDETFYVLKGQMLLEFEDHKHRIKQKISPEGSTKRIFPGTKHRLIGFTDVDIIEISTQHFDEDSIRLVDSDRPDIHVYTEEMYE